MYGCYVSVNYAEVEKCAQSMHQLLDLPRCFALGALVMISRTELYRFTSQVNNYLQVG